LIGERPGKPQVGVGRGAPCCDRRDEAGRCWEKLARAGSTGHAAAHRKGSGSGEIRYSDDECQEEGRRGRLRYAMSRRVHAHISRGRLERPDGRKVVS